MREKLFHGYNCFSAVLGQHFINTNMLKAMDSILIRWNFDFNKEMIFDNVWFVGACVEPADYLLQYDLCKFEGIEVTGHKSNPEEANKILTEEVKNIGSHLVMVDFYSLKSIDWDRMKRFGYYPKHLPHYINIVKETKENVIYQDPLYRFVGEISKEELAQARNTTVCDYDIDFEYYKIDDIGLEKNYRRKDKIYYQFQRYLDNGQLDKIASFSDSLKIIKDRLDGSQDFNWAFNIYLALESVVSMRQNIANILVDENVVMRDEVLSLILKWVAVRRDFLRIYEQKDLSSVSSVMDKLYHIRNLEKKLAKTILGKMG